MNSRVGPNYVNKLFLLSFQKHHHPKYAQRMDAFSTASWFVIWSVALMHEHDQKSSIGIIKTLYERSFVRWLNINCSYSLQLDTCDSFQFFHFHSLLIKRCVVLVIPFSFFFLHIHRWPQTTQMQTITRIFTDCITTISNLSKQPTNMTTNERKYEKRESEGKKIAKKMSEKEWENKLCEQFNAISSEEWWVGLHC